EIDPDYGPAYVGLGSTLVLQFQITDDPARLRDAEATFRKAIAVCTRSRQMIDRQAGALPAPGKLEESLRRGVREGPSFALADGKLGEVLMAQGRYREALAAFGQCHELGSKLPRWTYPSA